MAIHALKAHLAINVRDVSASLGFYRRLFGIEPSKVRIGYAKFDLANPPLNFTLNQHPFDNAGALSHLGIQVESTRDVLEMREDWQQRGLITRDEMQTNCCFATQDKTWVKDPDGNEWEVFVVLEDNLPEISSTVSASSVASCCAPACCEEQTGSAALASCATPAANETDSSGAVRSSW